MLALLAALALTLAACGPADTAAVPDASAALAPSDTAWTDAERTVREAIARDGVHVVHFWAPWCGNSTNEFAQGWYEVVEAHPEVSFTFVTVWNDGETGQRTLDRYGIPPSVTVLAQPDLGPSADRALRRRTFLGLPLTWTPTTWIFNRNGALAYAFNYGEVSPDELTAALAAAAASWEH
jgi:thiol-disulfide isomerase/thioredoxin